MLPWYNGRMPRITRTDIGEEMYHVLNRANARVQIFDNDQDYKIFESILAQAIERFDMRLLAYCIMPNHWHLIVHPKQDGDLSKFVGWLSNTHTRRWHTTKKTIGEGHLYQGRYKSFLCQKDNYFLTLVRYVERNAKKAGLCELAQDWQWSSIYRREKRTTEQKIILSEWPVDIPDNYLLLVNQDQNINEEEVIENSIIKSSPYGNIDWAEKAVKDFGLEQTLRRVGRPKNGG
ncbi:MAG: transposase [Candidatus Pacebacteria bacterium]|nr:transposase [Candidatus Paceibacterota bacterium]